MLINYSTTCVATARIYLTNNLSDSKIFDSVIVIILETAGAILLHASFVHCTRHSTYLFSITMMTFDFAFAPAFNMFIDLNFCTGFVTLFRMNGTLGKEDLETKK